MSRLADMLHGMDRGVSRPHELGRIASLEPADSPRRSWRLKASLVILVVMAGLAVAALLRTHGAVSPLPPPPPLSAPAPSLAPALPPAPVPAPSADLLRQGLEAAHSGAAGEAAALFRKALELDGSNAEAWNDLGVALARQADWNGATDAFRKAIRSGSRHAEAHRNLAVALDRRGKSTEAVEHYRAFLTYSESDHPDRESVRQRLGDLAPSPAPKADR